MASKIIDFKKRQKSRDRKLINKQIRISEAVIASWFPKGFYNYTVQYQETVAQALLLVAFQILSNETV